MDGNFLMLVILGFFASFIGTLAGGQGIITLPGMMLLGIPIHTGIATNKISNGFACFTSVLYLWKKRLVDIKTIKTYVAIALGGGVLGACITSSINERTMSIVALCLLVFALAVALKQKDWVATVQEKRVQEKRFQKLVLFLITVYDGGFGPGSSTFSILHFMNQGHSYVKSVQFTRVLIFGSCLGAFIVYYQAGVVQWQYAIAMAIGSAAGSQIGILALPRIPIHVAKSLLISILFLLIGQMVYKIL